MITKTRLAVTLLELNNGYIEAHYAFLSTFVCLKFSIIQILNFLLCQPMIIHSHIKFVNYI